MRKIYLREYRNRSKLKLEQAAAAVKVAPATIQRWETGQISLSVANLVDLAEVYGVDPEDCFAPPGESHRASDDEKALAAKARLADDIHPAAYLWMNEDFEKLDQAKVLSDIMRVADTLSLAFLKHWLEVGKTYPKEARGDRESRRRRLTVSPVERSSTKD